MGSEEIFEKVKKVIMEQLGVSDSAITLEASFIDDLGADSLDVFQIITELEDRLGVQIPENVLEEISTVEDALVAINDAT